MNVLDLLDRPIAYHRVFVTLTGSVKAAILLSQALYWQKRARQKDGWWYKSAEEWHDETGLTRHEQDSARKACEKYLKTDLRGVPATLHWKIDDEALSADLIAINRQTSLPESGKLDSRIPANIKRNAETTTETTQREREKSLDFENMTIPQARKVPTLKMYTDATGWFPADILWEKVHRTITENKLTADKIRAAAIAWAGRGYKRGNVEGILDWAINGIPGNGKTPTAPASSDPMSEFDQKFGSLVASLERQKTQS